MMMMSSYRIRHVSNNGKRKFYINRSTGRVEVVSRVLAGETYSITVEALDNSQKSSQTILEVTVSQGPNILAPQFEQIVYDAEVGRNGLD